MSFSFRLSGEPDYRIVGGRLQMSFGADAVRDRLYTALSTQLGEWFLDFDDGVPYYGEGGILGGKMTEAEVGSLIRRRILLDPDVDRIETMQIRQDTERRVTVTADVVIVLGNGTNQTITLEV